MWQHPSTQHNVEKVIGYGNKMITPAYGELASGLTGIGRMAEPEEILEALHQYFNETQSLKGKKSLVTAGPTYEAIDPVRFIGNNSSGKMGFAIAEELANRGSEVTLIAGPTGLTTHHPNIRTLQVTSAEDMYQSCIANFSNSDITVLSAAVADYRPVQAAAQKIKKTENGLMLELVKTKDIAAELGKIKKAGQLVVGFALETENEQRNAQNMIVLNSLNDPGAGFGHDTNKITLIDKDQAVKFSLKSKKEVARDIVNAIVKAIA
jgi:phosphopantothenoylcysteine decarboxylase / phosphopantothenate---cysteine ligase